MNWLINLIWSSIGKKLIMAITGLCFCGFLAVHLAGNLTLYGGSDLFSAYAEHLHQLGPLITIVEWGLLLLAVTHVIAGMILFYQNQMARPVRYKRNKSAGGRTIGSATMPYTGALLLFFIIIHLIEFHFADKIDRTMYQIMLSTFSNPVKTACYISVMIIAAFHISHGFWSAFQTLGANHPKYMPFIKGASTAFSLIVGIGFSSIPIYMFLIS
jgi:succinate dehydrogenase / fumarate reductase cytochrome b subunit